MQIKSYPTMKIINAYTREQLIMAMNVILDYLEGPFVVRLDTAGREGGGGVYSIGCEWYDFNEEAREFTVCIYIQDHQSDNAMLKTFRLRNMNDVDKTIDSVMDGLEFLPNDVCINAMYTDTVPVVWKIDDWSQNDDVDIAPIAKKTVNHKKKPVWKKDEKSKTPRKHVNNTWVKNLQVLSGGVAPPHDAKTRGIW